MQGRNKRIATSTLSFKHTGNSSDGCIHVASDNMLDDTDR